MEQENTTMEQENATMEQENTGLQMVDLTTLQNTQTNMYCSLPTTTEEERLIVFSKTQNPDYFVKDVVNTPIELTNVFVENIIMENGDIAPRILLFDKKGKSYQCVSHGMLSNLRKLFGLMGQPPYATPIKIVPKLVKTKRGQTFSLDIAK